MLKGKVRQGSNRERGSKWGTGNNKYIKKEGTREGKRQREMWIFPLVWWYDGIIRSLMRICRTAANRLKVSGKHTFFHLFQKVFVVFSFLVPDCLLYYSQAAVRKVLLRLNDHCWLPSIYLSIPISPADLLNAIGEYVQLMGKKVEYNDFSFAATAWDVLR